MAPIKSKIVTKSRTCLTEAGVLRHLGKITRHINVPKHDATDTADEIAVARLAESAIQAKLSADVEATARCAPSCTELVDRRRSKLEHPLSLQRSSSSPTLATAVQWYLLLHSYSAVIIGNRRFVSLTGGRRAPRRLDEHWPTSPAQFLLATTYGSL